MNVQPGDLARIVHPHLYGRLVEVLHAAPQSLFRLPDGKTHHGCDADEWVVEFLGPPITAWTGPSQGVFSDSRTTRYAVCGDRWLRPIRDPGDEAIDQMLERVQPPVRETERAAA